MAASLLAIVLAFGIGYGAQRGGLCVVTGVEHFLDRRSARLLLALLRTSVWSMAISIAIFWLVPSAHVSATYAISFATLLGGIVFGIGAAVNGGCAFGTLTRLGAGDFSFALTLVGVAIGIDATHWLALNEFGQKIGPTFLGTPSVIGAGVLLVSGLVCAREALTRRTGSNTGGWPAEYSAILIGTTGGALYALTGNWSFTLLLHQVPTQGGGEAPNLSSSILISSAALSGAIAAAVATREFRPRVAPKWLPRRVIGGMFMGFGAALIPGGNGVLELQGMPALSPHAVPAYLALIGGAALAIIVMRKTASLAISSKRKR